MTYFYSTPCRYMSSSSILIMLNDSVVLTTKLLMKIHRIHWTKIQVNKVQSNLATGDITHWYSPGGSTHIKLASVWCICNPQFGGRVGCRGSAMVQFEIAIVITYRLSIVPIDLSLTIRPQFSVECHRCSSQQGVGHLGRKGLTGVSQILTRSGRDMGLSYAKEIVLISRAVWSQCMNVIDRQRDRSCNGNVNQNKHICLSAIACERFCLKTH